MKLEEIFKQKFLPTFINFELLTLYSIYLLAILVPVFIGKPQLLVGSIINTLIVFSVLTYGIRKSIPVLLLPSLTATSMGILFGGATFFLLYLTPFIIISNLLYAYFISKEKTYFFILAILLKGIFLYLVYRELTQFIGLPTIFLTSSYLQFVTASVGVALGYTLFNLSKK